MYRIVIGAIIVAAVSGCDAGQGHKLNGTGSTSVQPIMSRWAEEYQKAKGGSLHYEAIGSSAGLHRLATGVFDFACTDAPLNEAQRAAVTSNGGDVFYIPLVLGGVVPVYHLPGLKGPLIFSGPVLADIFLGKITRWNNEALRQLNPDATLPDTPMAVVHRSDGSGTTYLWTDYLAKVSPEWKKKVDVGMSVAWPVGSGAAGSAGVAQRVKETPGALSYLQLNFATRLSIAVGLVKNRAGAPVTADAPSVAAARSALAEILPNQPLPLTDAPGDNAYPISGAVWAVVYVKQPAGKGKALADFLHWAVHEGQEFAEGLHYARLPGELVGRIDAKLDNILRGP
jgi:phosphate transport system substrate-binding protein